MKLFFRHTETHTANLLLTIRPPPPSLPTGVFRNGIIHSAIHPLALESKTVFIVLYFSLLRSQSIATLYTDWLTQLPSKSDSTAQTLTPQMHMLCVRLKSRVCISIKNEKKAVAPGSLNIFTLLWIRFRCFVCLISVTNIFVFIFDGVFSLSLSSYFIQYFFLFLSRQLAKKSWKVVVVLLLLPLFFWFCYTCMLFFVVVVGAYSLNGICLQLYWIEFAHNE